MSSDFWFHRNVLITGCTGLLGSWLTQDLVDENSNVIGLIRDGVPKSNLHRSGYFNKMVTVRGEIENYSILQRILNEYEVCTVFHLAAQTIVPIANKNPMSTFESNIKGTWNVLEACRGSSSVERVIIASSDKAYGCQEELPYDETSCLEGQYPYDVSKSCADLISKAYYHTYGLPVCITRCGNFYGGGDLNFNRIVPGTIRSIIFQENPVIRSDGKLIRDYFYIEDGVGAYTLLAEKMTKKIHGEAFNFSNERPVSVIDLVNIILQMMESDLVPSIQNFATNEIPEQYLSSRKARGVLGWRPHYTLENGLKNTIEWYKSFFLM